MHAILQHLFQLVSNACYPTEVQMLQMHAILQLLQHACFNLRKCLQAIKSICVYVHTRK